MTDEQPETDVDYPDIDDAVEQAPVDTEQAAAPARRIDWSKAVAFGVLPALAAILALGAGYLKSQVSSETVSRSAATESVAAARDATAAMLAYAPDTAERDLLAARDRLMGTFLDSYSDLVTNVVIPGAKEKKISSTVQVPAAGSVSAKSNHAVVLLFVDQSTTIGKEAPSNTTSTVRVTLDKVGDKWMVSGFEPI